jgi:outer membrane lipoprotein-sorting protein
MNDNHLPSDELLQFLFGELNGTQQAAVRKAVAEDAELAATAQGLAAAVAAVRAENVCHVSDEFNDRLRRRMPEVLDSVQAEMTRPTFRTRALDNWRWVMRSPASRVAAATVLVLVIGGVALWFPGGGATPALADFLKPILEAKTAKFKMILDIEGKKPITVETMYWAPYRTRGEYEMPNKSVTIAIEDGKTGNSLLLTPDEKLAVLNTVINRPAERQPSGPGFFIEMRSQLLDARGNPDFKRELLGEKEIDGHQAVGYRFSGRPHSFPAMVFSLWGDPKTMLPVRVEMDREKMSGKKTKVTMTDFVFNVDLDESLFSLEPPAGYTTQTVTRDGSPAEEKDLVETFSRYSQLSGGAFPDVLDYEAAARLFKKHWEKSHPLSWWRWLWNEPQSQEERQELWNEHDKLTKGLTFVSVELPPEADAHYAGKGVSLGAADTPIFWYRPKDSNKYRVIYADLSVRDADASPNVPNAQPVPAPPSPKQ